MHICIILFIVVCKALYIFFTVYNITTTTTTTTTKHKLWWGYHIV